MGDRALTPYRPLDGVRVLSFEVAASLPAGTRTLADLGADVVRVAEPPNQDYPYIRVFDSSTINKRSIAIDLREEAGRSLAMELALAADVVCNNFRPRVLERFGLGSTALLERKPGIVVLQLTGFGAPGPWKDYPAYGPAVEAAAGLNAMMGEPDDLPQRVGSGVFGDTLAGRYAALAVCAALLRVQSTGLGEYIDLSMYECVTATLGDLVVRASRTGAVPARLNNRSLEAAPQGVYPAFGEDEWVAITVSNDAEWVALRTLLATPRLHDTDLDHLAGRRGRHDEIDLAISQWTRSRTKVHAAETLQAAGIPAGPVQKPRDVPLDPQHVANGFFQQVRHLRPILGYSTHPHMRLPGQVSGCARTALSDHQPEGGAAEQIIRSWLGDAGLARHQGAVAFGPARAVIPDGTPRPWWFGARDAGCDADFAERLELMPAEVER